MRIIHTGWLSIFLFFAVLAVAAQTKQPQIQSEAAQILKNLTFRTIDRETGLSQNSVYDIVQDTKGYMWFATQDGLNRWDGYSIDVYKPSSDGNNSTLPHNFIRALELDRQGRIWIGTWGGGIAVYEPQTEEFSRFTKAAGHADLPEDTANVFDLKFDRDNNLWILTSAGNLYKLSIKEKRCELIVKQPFVESVSIGESGVWIGTRNGVWKYNNSDQTLESLISPHSAGFEALSSIVKVVYEHAGLLWIGTKSGAFTYQLESGQLRKVELPQEDQVAVTEIRAVAADDSGNIWLGTFENGLYVQLTAGEVYHFNGNRILALTKTESGLMYAGTGSRGVDRFLPGGKAFNRLFDEGVWKILEDSQGTMWFCMDGQGVRSYKPHTGEMGTFIYESGDTTSPPSGSVFTATEVSQEEIWFGTSHGLWVYDLNVEAGRRVVFNNPQLQPLNSDQIWEIYEDSQQNLWIGTRSNGLFRIGPLRSDVQQYQLNSVFVYTVYEDSRGGIWAGTIGAGLHFLNEDGTFTVYDDFPNNFILDIHEDESGSLWISSNGGGLYRFYPDTEAFEVYAEQDGLPSNVVYGIQSDTSGSYWMGSNNGLVQFNPQLMDFKVYTSADGLPGNEFNGKSFAAAEGGRFYFGGPNGVVDFIPAQIDKRSYNAPVHITDFLLFNEPIKTGAEYNQRTILEKAPAYTDTIELTHSESVITITFAAFDMLEPSHNLYRYRLEGFDGKWNHVDSQRRYATYTNLPPGRYTFRVQGTNSDRIWSRQEDKVEINIIPPWWRTLPFYIALGFIVFLLLEFGYQWRMRTVHRRNKQLQYLYQQEQKSAQAKLRLQELLQGMIDSMPSVLIAIDHSGVVNQWNNEAEHMTGITGETAIGKRIEGLFPSIQSELGKWRDALERDELLRYAKVPYAEHGETKIKDIIIYPYHSTHESGAVIRIDDITEKVNMEELFIQSEKMVSIGGIAAGMAHELNNPLGIVLQSLQNVRRRLDPRIAKNQMMAGEIGVSLEAVAEYMQQREILEYFEHMRSAGSRASDIVRGMLNFSRRSDIQKEYGSIEETVQRAIQFAKLDYQLKKHYRIDRIRINLNFSRDIPQVFMKSGEIEQVLVNLIKNSTQSFPKEKIDGEEARIDIRVFVQDENVVLKVFDNGSGMNAEVRDAVFQPFFTTKQREEGTGLGLSVSHFIITRNHGGKLGVESELGKGTAFTVTLPVEG